MYSIDTDPYIHDHTGINVCIYIYYIYILYIYGCGSKLGMEHSPVFQGVPCVWNERASQLSLFETCKIKMSRRYCLDDSQIHTNL